MTFATGCYTLRSLFDDIVSLGPADGEDLFEGVLATAALRSVGAVVGGTVAALVVGRAGRRGLVGIVGGVLVVAHDITRATMADGELWTWVATASAVVTIPAVLLGMRLGPGGPRRVLEDVAAPRSDRT